jgi:hypothetical protein
LPNIAGLEMLVCKRNINLREIPHIVGLREISLDVDITRMPEIEGLQIINEPPSWYLV